MARGRGGEWKEKKTTTNSPASCLDACLGFRRLSLDYVRLDSANSQLALAQPVSVFVFVILFLLLFACLCVFVRVSSCCLC